MSDISMINLKKAAEEMNVKFEFTGDKEDNKPIVTKVGTKKVVLIKELQEIIKCCLNPDDVFSEETTETIKWLEEYTPDAKVEDDKQDETTVSDEKVEDVPIDETPVDEVPPQEIPKETKAKVVKNNKTKTVTKAKVVKQKKEKFTRAHAFGYALSDLGKKGATKKELMVKANEIYMENGGSNREDVSQRFQDLVLPTLLFFNVIEEKEKGFIKLCTNGKKI